MQPLLASVAENAIYRLQSTFQHPAFQSLCLSLTSLQKPHMSPGQMENQKTSVEYRPLRDSEIRLVSFQKNQGASSPFELRLEHFESPKAPSYIALSYVWGDPNNSHPVMVNGQNFNVTQNLNEALLHIYKLSSIFEQGLGQRSEGGQVHLFLWIDALCINQRDIDERSKQISRMTQIFSSAFTVLVWLGTSEELELDQLDFEHLLYYLELVLPYLDFPKSISTSPYSISQREPEKNLVRLRHVYRKIIECDWFSRVWVLQEHALSQRKPCAMIGDNPFSLESFYAFGSAYSRALGEKSREDPGILGKDRVDSLLFNSERLTRDRLGTTFLRELIASREFQDKSLANQLLSIKGNQGIRNTTVLHDQIYGLLGMVNLTRLPTQLTPNYRLSYGQVCKDYTKFIIENTRDLRILMFLRYTVGGQPSWVNGFYLDTPWHIEPAVRHTGFFSSDGESLVVEGVRCGKILSFFFGGYDMTGERMQQFYDTIFSIAGEIRQQPHADAWKEWLSEFLEYACRVPGDHANRYQSVSDFLANALPGHSNGLSDGFHGSSVLKMFSLSDFALVDDGKVVGCERRPAQGLDGEFQVWAFKGSTNLSIVHQERPDKYRYYGWLRTPDVVLNEEFFSSHEVERITLT